MHLVTPKAEAMLVTPKAEAMLEQRGKCHCTVDIRTSQTGGQWYSDTSPFSIHCLSFSLTNLCSLSLSLIG